MKRAVFTICASNNLSEALNLLNSLSDALPAYDFFLLFAEDVEKVKINDPLDSPFKLLTPSVLLNQWKTLAFQYEKEDFLRALKPFMFEDLFRKGYESVLYFDSWVKTDPSFKKVDAYFEAHEVLLISNEAAKTFSGQNELFRSEFLGLKDTNPVRTLLSHWQQLALKPEFSKKYSTLKELEEYLLSALPAICEKVKIIHLGDFEIFSPAKNPSQGPLEYAFSRYEDGEKIQLSDRRKYLSMHPLQRKQIENPFNSKESIREIKHAFAFLEEVNLVLQQYNIRNDLQLALEKVRAEKAELQNSFSLKVGLWVTYPLRKARQIIKQFFKRNL
jgi:hypothetical protein